MAQWDLLIRGAKVFDGEGTPGRIEDVAVQRAMLWLAAQTYLRHRPSSAWTRRVGG